jgi:anti-sigma regulatory factor (Ser/Thr protein kinase)
MREFGHPLAKQHGNRQGTGGSTMDGAVHLSAGWDLARAVSAPRSARRMLAAQLLTWGIGEPERAAAAMIATELVTNAVEHAATPSQLRVHYDGVVLVIEVRDGCTAAPRLQAPTTGITGRGLQLVDRLAARWNYVLHPDGKTIWADIQQLDDPSSPPAETRIGRSDGTSQ